MSDDLDAAATWARTFIARFPGEPSAHHLTALVNAAEEDARNIRAPFTRTQQQALYRWQSDGTKHPFTCPHCPDQPLSVGAHWYCPDCGYTQYWAHAFMVTSDV